MGCWDVFCFICGNPCHGVHDFTIDYIQEILNTEKLLVDNFVKNMQKK